MTLPHTRNGEPLAPVLSLALIEIQADFGVIAGFV
jgi:hypothetical protein